MPIEELKKLREKYPQYSDIPDQELAQKIISKYPQYTDLFGDIARPGMDPASFKQFKLPVQAPPPPKVTFGDVVNSASEKMMPIDTLKRLGQKTFIDEGGRIVGPGGAPVVSNEEMVWAAGQLAQYGLHMRSPALKPPSSMAPREATEALEAKITPSPAPTPKSTLQLPGPGETAPNARIFTGKPMAEGGLPEHYNLPGRVEERPRFPGFEPHVEVHPPTFAKEVAETTAKPATPSYTTISGGGPIEGPALTTSAERQATPRSQIFSKDDMPPGKPMVSVFADRVQDGIAQRVKDWVTEWTPRTMSITKQFPSTNLVTSTERLFNSASEQWSKFLDSSAGRALYKYDPDHWVEAEQLAYDIFRKTKNRGEAMAAVAQKYPGIADLVDRLRVEWYPKIQEARKVLGLEPIKDFEEIYFPHMVDLEKEAVQYVGSPSAGVTGLRANIGSFAKPRESKLTILEQWKNAKHSTEFHDPRVSYAYYERLAGQLEATANYIKELKGTILFDSEKAARTEGHMKPVEIRAFVPNGKSWWVPNKDVAQFFHDNFELNSSPKWDIWRYAKQIFRNPNLFNPLPHVKNLTWLYKTSGGSVARLPGLMTEYVTRSNPSRVALFEEVMPHTTSLKSGHDLFRDTIKTLEGKQNTADYIKAVMNKVQKPSQQVLWNVADPGMKYARWVQYMERNGGNAQAAANQVMMDMVRYGERGQILNLLKDIPMNFFVPWRWGNFVSTFKAAQNRPLQLALTVGVVDYIREAIYRNTGWWMTLPIDHFEAPVYMLAQAGKAGVHGDFIAALKDTSLALTSVVAPGISAKFRDVFNPTDMQAMSRVFWGWSQLGEMYTDTKKAIQTGDVTEMLKALGTTMGARDTIHPGKPSQPEVGYSPGRLGAILPEGLPGLTPTWKVKSAEKRSEQHKQKMDDAARKRFWDQHPDLRQVLYGS